MNPQSFKDCIFLSLEILLFILVFQNCAIGPVNGFIFTTNRFAGQFQSTNDVKFEKEASSCMHQFFGLVALGTAGIGKTAKDGGIKRIALVDHSTTSILFLVYGRYCTYVYGE